MIDSNGNLHCDGCNKKLAIRLIGYLEMYCPKCHYFNKFDTGKLPIYNSHGVAVLDKTV